jgi:soluble lytic murein transglycosylase
VKRAADGGSGPARAPRRRLRLVAVVLVVLAAAGTVVALVIEPLGDAVREVTLPLRHDDIIRQQAREKDLDPALIAAIIYEESRFRPRTSPAGAEGLMQITPQTADFIAERSGATEFELSDLGDPQINISYGSFYLRHLLDRYGGNEELAIAAYNAGGTNVDQWVADAGGAEAFDAADDIPFPETREYVRRVGVRQEQYRRFYAEDLGL